MTKPKVNFQFIFERKFVNWHGTEQHILQGNILKNDVSPIRDDPHPLCNVKIVHLITPLILSSPISSNPPFP
jgi:hypothetical protein